MTTTPPVTQFLLLLGLGFFFGLAFEEFYAQTKQPRPGGVRSFPLLALMGALFYQLDPTRLILLSVGLLVLGGWLACYYWRHTGEGDAEGAPNVGLMVPICSMLAYLLGPITMAGPPWMAVGTTVSAVLLLTAREKLHAFAHRVNTGEIVTAGKFLLLTGFVLPVLPDTPVMALTDITPHQVWLAVLAVCTISYASYLLQRYVVPRGARPLVAVLGGFYSSTATTVVLARNARTGPVARMEAETGIILATAVMYLRLLIIILIFNHALALLLAPFLSGLALLGVTMAGGCYWMGRRVPRPEDVAGQWPTNPLDLGAAAAFALLFVAVSIAASWAGHFGAAGIYGLAAMVGVTDIDPFVLSLAQHGIGSLPNSVGAIAIVVAASSNNLLKAAYTIGYSGGSIGPVPTVALVVLAACGVGLAVVMV
jgi:uncharacterized membrane protein (DUF4010 family)